MTLKHLDTSPGTSVFTGKFARLRAGWLLPALLLVSSASLPIRADTILYWDLAGRAGNETDVPPTVMAEGLGSSSLLRGPGLNPAGLVNGFSADNFTVGADLPNRDLAVEKGEWIGLGFTVQLGYVASLESLDISLRRSALNGPMFYELQYSLDNFATPGTKIVDFSYRGRASGTNVPTSTNPEEYMVFGVPPLGEYGVTEPDGMGSFVLPPDLAGQSGGASTPGNPMPTIDLSGIPELQDLPGGTTVTFALFSWGNTSTTATNTVAFGRLVGPELKGEVILDPALGDKVPLEIISEIPSTDPAPGSYTLDKGSLVTASASMFTEGENARILPIGWIGTGSAGDGTGDSVTFTLNDPTSIEWLWERETRLQVTSSGDGSVRVGITSRFPLLGFDFAGWNYIESGDYPPGQQSNLAGVPASTVASDVQPSTITRGWGLRPRTLSIGGISSEGWNNTLDLTAAINNGTYLEFNLTPQPGASLEVNSIYVPYRYTQTAANTLALVYSFDYFGTFSVAETVVIQDNASGTQTGSHLFLLPDDPRLQNITSEVLFRIYGWGGTGGTGTFAIRNSEGPGVDDMVIYGGSTTFSEVAGAESFWVDETSVVNLEALAGTGALFTGWSGDAVSNALELRRIEMPIGRSYTAAFEASADGLIPDSWKAANLEGLPSGAGDDPDEDGFTNLEEYLRGTNPAFAEELLSAGNVVVSPWENTQRDPMLAGGLVVRDFGMGFRGVWEGTNHNRSALLPFTPDGTVVPVVPNVSFDGPRMILRDEVWDASWNDSTVETVFSVGDDDGTALYFRYQDEMNWYRVVVSGEINTALNRPLFGVSVQKRVDGVYSEMASSGNIGTDPNDVAWYKRVRISVEQNGPNLQIRVIGWDVSLSPPDFSPGSEVVLDVFDTDLEGGRAGVGTWAQGGAPGGTVHPEWNPVNNGTLFESFRVVKNGSTVFEDDWATAPLVDELPAGWENAFEGVAGLSGNWRNSAHGTIAQVTTQGGATSSTSTLAFADADGPVLLGPDTGALNYVIDSGIHAFSFGAAGLVFDYLDEDNFGRVLFVNQPSLLSGGMPPGVVVSRKQNGVWTDLFIADTTFVYTRARPFETSLSRSGAGYVLTVREEGSDHVHRWQWEDSSAPNVPGRHGLTSWQAPHTHFLFLDIYGAEAQVEEGLGIVSISKVGETIVLGVDNPSGSPYRVQRSADLVNWTDVATGQTSETWTGDIPTEHSDRLFWRLVR